MASYDSYYLRETSPLKDVLEYAFNTKVEEAKGVFSFSYGLADFRVERSEFLEVTSWDCGEESTSLCSDIEELRDYVEEIAGKYHP